MNITKKVLTRYVCPALTVVTDDCHADSILVFHVTINRKWSQASLAIRINEIISAFTANVLFYRRTGRSCNWGIDLNFSFYCFYSISRSTGVVSLVRFLNVLNYKCPFCRRKELTGSEDLPSLVQVILGLRSLSASHGIRRVEPNKGATT